MKKHVNRVLCVFLSIAVLVFSVVIVRAEMVFQHNNHRYTILSDGSISLYGRSDSDAQFSIPAVIDNKMIVDIRNYAYYGDSAMEKVDFTDAYFLRRIGSFAFAGCNALSGSLVLPSGLQIVENGAFQGTNISSFEINSVLTIVPQQCCYNCPNLSSVLLGDSITEIRDYAFYSCNNLEYVVIPATVTIIADTAFDNSIKLGVYYDSTAYHYALNKGIDFVVLDPENMPNEPTEPEPTEVPTEAPTDEPTAPATEAPTEASVKYLGDIDGDGTVTSIDATLIQRHLCNIKTMISDEMFMLGDVDGDGIITIIDVTFIMRYLATIEVPYPIGEPIINN